MTGMSHCGGGNAHAKTNERQRVRGPSYSLVVLACFVVLRTA
jgi:hypothetical protein